jgi:hypothetical protein
MDDVFLMADDAEQGAPPSIPALPCLADQLLLLLRLRVLQRSPAQLAARTSLLSGQGGDEVGDEIGSAAPLALDALLSGVLPGAASSELGAGFLDDVLGPGDEDISEEDFE